MSFLEKKFIKKITGGWVSQQDLKRTRAEISSEEWVYDWEER